MTNGCQGISCAEATPAHNTATSKVRQTIENRLGTLLTMVGGTMQSGNVGSSGKKPTPTIAPQAKTQTTPVK
jgi:hypothetical protein